MMIFKIIKYSSCDVFIRHTFGVLSTVYVSKLVFQSKLLLLTIYQIFTIQIILA